MNREIIFHPFLFGVYPILFLYAQNVRQSLKEIVVPVVIMVCFTFIIMKTLNKYLKDRNKTGLISSAFLILFFSYGHILGMMPRFEYFIFNFIGPNKINLTLLGIILFFCIFISIRSKRNFRFITQLFNSIGSLLIVMVLFQIGIYKIESSFHKKNTLINGSQNSEVKSDLKLPNIYYIILDAYGRSDNLKEIYDFDNSEFLNFLKNNGFFIANKSFSNYCLTELSLPSSLNLEYIQSLLEKNIDKYANHGFLEDLIQHNKVFSFLKKYGYSIISFKTGCSDTEIKKTDKYLDGKFGYFSEFQTGLINTTPIEALIYRRNKLNPYNAHRKIILFLLDHLGDLDDRNSPYFVFAHILSPHPPFVFNRKGEPVQPKRIFSQNDGSDFLNDGGTKEEYQKNYIEQLIFINEKVKKIINKILLSNKNVIIILQSDHGPGSMLDWANIEKTNLKERFGILNAIYLPNKNYQYFSDNLSPVNTFRILFNQYFKEKNIILENKHFFSNWHQPYQLTEVQAQNIE